MPIAVISTASLGAARSGLYASRSMLMPRIVHTTIAPRTAAIGGSPRYCIAQNAT